MKKIKYVLFLCLALLTASCSNSDDDTYPDLNTGTDGTYSGFFSDEYRLSPYEEQKDYFKSLRDYFKFTCSILSEEDNETFEVTDVLSRAQYDLVLSGSSAKLKITRARMVTHKRCYVADVTYTYEPGTYEFDYGGQHFDAEVLGDVIMINGQRSVNLNDYKQTISVVKECEGAFAAGPENENSVTEYTLTVSDTQDGDKILSNGTIVFKLTKQPGGYELRQTEPDNKHMITLVRQ